MPRRFSGRDEFKPLFGKFDMVCLSRFSLVTRIFQSTISLSLMRSKLLAVFCFSHNTKYFLSSRSTVSRMTSHRSLKFKGVHGF
jgi:hypothetical protein